MLGGERGGLRGGVHGLQGGPPQPARSVQSNYPRPGVHSRLSSLCQINSLFDLTAKLCTQPVLDVRTLDSSPAGRVAALQSVLW